ncbi:MAG TPA: hypothetical protein PKH92_06490 [Anaerolineaceae bacterium]|nr:hypothetical protein [Anaerolineaceae bacterium]
MKKLTLILLLALTLLLAACGGGKDQRPHSETVAEDKVVDLACGALSRKDCLARLCADPAACPVLIALAEPAVFDFIATYAACPDCNTPDFAPEDGIGKCVEYQTSDAPSGWEVTFWVSEACAFRYGSPTESRVVVRINPQTLEIKKISPSVEIIADPLYCQNKADCVSLSGSGVPFTGCSNSFYGPLNWSGYYAGTECTCQKHQCVAAAPKK